MVRSFSPVKKVNFEKSHQTVIYPYLPAAMMNIHGDGADELSTPHGLNIYDTTGKLVLSPEPTPGPVDVNALKKGFYVVQILKKSDQIRKNDEIASAKSGIPNQN